MLVTNLNEGNSSFNTLKKKAKKKGKKYFPQLEKPHYYVIHSFFAQLFIN